jgi:hypothetical protein
MLKLLFLLVGLAIGFGGGVYWGQKNPEAAAKLSAEEEKRFLEAQVAISKKIQAKLDELQNKATAPKTPGAGFVGSGQSGPAAQEVKDVKAEAAKQEAELEKRISELK